MIDGLLEAIRTLRTRIQHHSSHIGDYEKRTRVSLIDPLLSTLGWDVSDPNLVEVETSTGNGWADYALLNTDRQPLVFIEAKKLSEREAPIRQVAAYAIEENSKGAHIRYCVCTNGDYWILLDIREQNQIIMNVNISQGNIHKIALKLLGLWRHSLQEDEVYAPAIEPIFTPEKYANVYHETSSVGAPLAVQPSTQFDRSSGNHWITIDSKFESTKQPAPAGMLLPDGSEVQLSRWYGVITQISKWLYNNGDLTYEKWSAPFGRRYLFSVDGKNPKDQRDFHNPKPIVDGRLYLETGLSNKEMLRYTKDILERCGYRAAEVRLRLSR